MNIKRKILLVILLLICVATTTCGWVGCANNDRGNIEKLNNQSIYRVYDSIYVYDLFKWKDGQNLSFYYTIDNGERIDLRGEFIYLKSSGVYNITAFLDNKTACEVSVEVVNPLPIMELKKEEIKVDFEKTYAIDRLINSAGIIIKSEFSHVEFVDKVLIYKDGIDAEPLIYDLVKGQEGADGLFDGNRFYFAYECDYLFKVYSETTGGRVYYDLTVHAIEDTSKLKDESVKYNFKFNADTLIASWNPVENATSYRIKYAGKMDVITETRIDLSEILTEEFYHFDFTVIPVNDNAENEKDEKLCKFVREDVVIAPESAQDLILGRGVKEIDTINNSVTLAGYQSLGGGYRTEIHATLNNSYIAFCNKHTGKYGLNTVVEFTFKGNNMPQLCFFADELNGDMSAFGGTGWLFVNGLYVTEKPAGSLSTTSVIGENILGLFGPNRIGANHENYWGASEGNKGNTNVSRDTLFTQKLLRETPNTEYKYTVRSYAQDGKLAFQLVLEETENNTIVANAIKVTDVDVSTIGEGYIIAYATVKGNDNDTTFKYNMPYAYEDNSDVNAKFSGVMYRGEREVYMFASAASTILAEQGSIYDSGWFSGVSRVNNSYIGFEKAFTVGKAIDIEFTGNNMPIMGVFTDAVNGNMGGNLSGEREDPDDPKSSPKVEQKGYIIAPGIYDSYNKKTWHENNLTVYGENRISKNVESYTPNVSTIGGQVYSGLNENVNYKYTVASAVEDEKVIIIMELYDLDTAKLLTMSKYETNKTVQEINSLGNNLVIYAGLKGKGEPTVLSYSEIYDYTYNGGFFQIQGGLINDDDSITLNYGDHPYAGAKDDGSMYGDGSANQITQYKNSYIAFKDVSKVGNYMDFYFTGKNIPYVTLFADKISQSMGRNSTGLAENVSVVDQNGYIIITNLQDYSNETLKHNYFEKNFHIDGPNRINSTLYERADNYNFTTVSGAFDGFTEGTNYKYTVGSRLDGTSVIIEIMLYEVDGETTTLIYSAKHDTGKTETEIEGLGSNLIAYGCVKGNYENTTFSYSDVYANPYDNEKIKIEGGIINQDGSVSLSAGRHPAGYQTQNGYLAEESGWKSGVSKYVNNYVAFKNQSKVGNYIDFIFTGNNMPLVTLFANSMSNSMGGNSTGNDTTLDQNGYIIATDLHDNTYELLDLSKPREVVVWCKDILRVWGPNRISGISPYQDAAQTTNLATILGEYAGLEDGTQYKYTVGSKLDTDETVLIEVFLYEGTTLKYHAAYDTSLTKDEVEALGSYIIAYAGVRGNVATTFSYSEAYQNNAFGD